MAPCPVGVEPAPSSRPEHLHRHCVESGPGPLNPLSVVQEDTAGESVSGRASQAFQPPEVPGANRRARLDLDADDPVGRALQDQIDLDPILVPVVADERGLVGQGGGLGDLRVNEAFEKRTEPLAIGRG